MAALATKKACPNCEADMPKDSVACSADGCGYTKSKKMDSVDRIDYWGPLTAEDRDSFGYTKKFTKTDEGFLTGKAIITSIGVFQYRQPNGSIRREARLPEEVFNPDSLASLSMKPVTLGHPKEKVTPENSAKLKVGSLGERIDTDGQYVYAPVSIMDAAAIAAVESGDARGMSCGYTCDMDETPGVYLGMPYDAVQRKIRYNHDALVSVPRAGDAAFIRMDSGEDLILSEPKPTIPEAPATKTDGTTPKTLRTGGDTMRKIRLDGAVEHEVPEAVAAHIEKLDGDLGAKAKEASELKAKLDSANEALTAEKKARADEAEGFQAKVDGAIASRLQLVELATGFGVEVKADSKDEDIRRDIILKASPTAKLDGQDAAYIQARFDTAVESLTEAKTKADAQAPNAQKAAAADGTPKTHADGDYRAGWANAHKRGQ